MLCASRNKRGNRPNSESQSCLPAFGDKSVGLLRSENALSLIGRCAKHADGVIVRQDHILDRLVGDGADPFDDLPGHRGRRLRVENSAAIVADDDARVRIAFRRKGEETRSDFGERDLLLGQIAGRGERLLSMTSLLNSFCGSSDCSMSAQIGGANLGIVEKVAAFALKGDSAGFQHVGAVGDARALDWPSAQRAGW